MAGANQFHAVTRIFLVACIDPNQSCMDHFAGNYSSLSC
jgi:hypothetical protein